jgi:tetratricopeptide (TPR) repeat protein
MIILFAVCATACKDSGEEHIRKAHVLFSNHRLEEAEKSYRAAIEVEPDSAVALEGLGNIAFERGDPRTAVTWYEKAAAADPRAVNARHRLAIARSELGDVQGAIKALEDALTIDAKNVFALHALGGQQQKLGQMKRAEELQLEALRLEPDHLGARFALASIFLDSGRTEEAERELSKLHASGAEALAEYGFARVEAKRGKFPEAAKRLSRVLELGVSHPTKILSDNAFDDAWSDPEMQAVRAKLEQAAKK